MPRIRKVEISHFRSIRRLEWTPSAGVNCLIGPGDSGKSTILDAIDLCLGARRGTSLSDTDFHRLDVTVPIRIALTVGELPDSLLNLDGYGDYLRGFDANTGEVEDEPRSKIEPVLTIVLTVGPDLEGVTTLFSERSTRQGLERSLAWKERIALAPARIGTYASSNFAWSRGSVLNRLTDTPVELGAALANAARDARSHFGEQAAAQFHETVGIVNDTARYLGVPIGASAKALLDAHSVSISDGAVSLHDENGVPLRALGIGSARLLVAGLQRMAARAASIALLDEVEYGLEPHRLAQLLNSLGSRDADPPLQVFMTSHSPVALRELSGSQVYVVRPAAAGHSVLLVGTGNDAQATLRADPESFLSKSILICEGKSEVGLARGLDLHWSSGPNNRSFFSLAGSFVDVGGSNPERCYDRGLALLRLGYRVLVIVDADRVATPAKVQAFHAAGGDSITWRDGRALEDELFLSLGDDAVMSLIAKACEIHGRPLIEEHVRSKSNGTVQLAEIEFEPILAGVSEESRRLLANAAKSSGWFKTLRHYEAIAREVIGPSLVNAHPDFQAIVQRLHAWMYAS